MRDNHPEDGRFAEVEELFQTLAETSPNMIFIEQGGRVVYVNQACCEVTGYAREELLASDFDFRVLIDPGDLGLVESAYREHMEGRRVAPYEYRLVTKGGTRLDAINATSIISHNGQLAILGVVTDISQRKRAEERIRAERDRAQHYLDIADVILIAVDMSGRIRMINRKGCEILGQTEAELVGQDWFETALPDDVRSRTRALFASLIEEEAEMPFFSENRVRSSSGEERWVAWRASLIRDQGGTISGLLSSGEDITERRKTEEALRTVEAKFYALFEGSRHPSVLEDLRGKVLACNEAFVALVGASGGPEDQVGRDATEFVVEEEIPRLQEQMRTSQGTGGTGRSWQFTLAGADGARIPVEGFSSAVHDQNGQPIYYVTQILDIAARKKAETALRETTERLRAFSSRLQDVREEERTAIARELHDELGQAMTGLRMDLAVCSDKLPEGRADLQDRLSQMIRLADDNIALVQNISSQLRPPVLDVLGLGPAVEWLVEEVGRRSDLAFDLDLAADEIEIDPKTSIAAFRVVQEALTNVIRHAKAKRVRIRLSVFGDQLMAEVADDGVGIPDDAVDHPRSVGLLGMSERAIAQGGSLEIDGEAGEGTRVLLALPLGGVPQVRELPR